MLFDIKKREYLARAGILKFEGVSCDTPTIVVGNFLSKAHIFECGSAWNPRYPKKKHEIVISPHKCPSSDFKNGDVELDC